VQGELEYNGNYTHIDTGQQSTASQDHVGTLRLQDSTYLWEPWFARLSGRLEFSLSQSRSDSSGRPTQTRSGELTTGELELSLLPRSRFPSRLWLERKDGRLTNDRLLGPAATTDRTVTRYGVQQQYRRTNGGDYRFRLEETTVEQSSDESRRDERLNWSLAGRENFNAHTVGLELRHDQVRRRQSESSSNDQDTFAARHSYTPGERNFSLNNLASLNRRQSHTSQGESQAATDQFSSTALWTSGGQRRLQLNGNVRVLGSSNKSAVTASEQQLLASNLGVRYRLSDHWRLSAGSGFTLQDSARTSEGGGRNSEQVLTQQYDAEIDYASPTRTFAGTSHSWNADLRSAYRIREDDAGDAYSANANLGVSQNLSRQLAEGGLGRLRGQLRQSVNHQESNGGEASSGLTHGLSLNWNRALASGSTYGELRFTDSRQYSDGGQERVFQLANLQVSMRQQPSPNQSFSLSATLQASRSGDADGFEEWNPSTSVGMTYLQQGVLGLYRMRWRSDLRYDSDNLLYLLRDENSLEAQDQVRWENRLDYSIGLLTTRFTTTLTENGGVVGQVYRLTLTRGF
jgi:hypothetical protein